MSRADYLALGDWNAQCDACGRKRKGSTLRLQWNGLWVCPEHWEPRQPQDFVKAVPEHPTPPFVRDWTSTTVNVCSPNSRTAISTFAIAGCMIAGYRDPAFDSSVTEPSP